MKISINNTETNLLAAASIMMLVLYQLNWITQTWPLYLLLGVWGLIVFIFFIVDVLIIIQSILNRRYKKEKKRKKKLIKKKRASKKVKPLY